MIYHCCGDCGERWLIGNPRTCKCPEEKPQREWVGLTDEEIMEIAFNFDVPSLVVRTAEAKLKGKNT